jgi:Zn-dependent protease
MRPPAARRTTDLAESPSFIARILVWAVPTVLAIILHEIMHGVVARAFGDDTAAQAGRLTLNPIRHIDPVGTILIPGMLLFLHLPVFGYAKPVPVNFSRLSPRRLGMIAVAAAGPLTNLTLAVLSARALRVAIGLEHPGLIAQMLYASVLVNVMIGVFNLFPLLPLDGGRVIVGLLPLRLARGYAKLEPYGFMILFLLLYTHTIGAMIDPVIGAVAGALLG